MNIWHDIREDRIKKNDFAAVIEIPKGCKNKYELDKETGLLRLDRISCICDLKYYHTYSIICNVNQIRSLGCTITCYFEPTFICHGTSYN